MADDADFAVLTHKVTTMHQDVTELRRALQDLTTAINRLVLVEERQNQTSIALERAFRLLERLEALIDALNTRVTALEIAEPEQKRVAGWVTSAAWSAAGILTMLVLAKAGLLT